MGRFLASAAAFLPYALGWAAGVAVRFVHWLWAAILAGFMDGRGGAGWDQAARRR